MAAAKLAIATAGISLVLGIITNVISKLSSDTEVASEEMTKLANQGEKAKKELDAVRKSVVELPTNISSAVKFSEQLNKRLEKASENALKFSNAFKIKEQFANAAGVAKDYLKAVGEAKLETEEQLKVDKRKLDVLNEEVWVMKLRGVIRSKQLIEDVSSLEKLNVQRLKLLKRQKAGEKVTKEIINLTKQEVKARNNIARIQDNSDNSKIQSALEEFNFAKETFKQIQKSIRERRQNLTLFQRMRGESKTLNNQEEANRKRLAEAQATLKRIRSEALADSTKYNVSQEKALEIAKNIEKAEKQLLKVAKLKAAQRLVNKIGTGSDKDLELTEKLFEANEKDLALNVARAKASGGFKQGRT